MDSIGHYFLFIRLQLNYVAQVERHRFLSSDVMQIYTTVICKTVAGTLLHPAGLRSNRDLLWHTNAMH